MKAQGRSSVPSRGPHSAPLAAALGLSAGKARSAVDLCTRAVREVPLLGMGAASKVFLAEASARRPLSRIVRSFAPDLVTISPAGYRSSLTFRRTDTDSAVIRQILVREEYRPIATLTNIRLIVDCGANIGASAYYLLHRFPRARLIAVEPDTQNVDLCRRNLAPFGDRAVVLQGALWPECCSLRIVPESRALGAWGLRVEPASAAESDVHGWTIPAILERADIGPPIDLLKMDIEGAEIDVFGSGCASWLDFTRHIAIELHGAKAEAAFTGALTAYSYERQFSGELTIIRHLRRLRD